MIYLQIKSNVLIIIVLMNIIYNYFLYMNVYIYLYLLIYLYEIIFVYY